MVFALGAELQQGGARTQSHGNQASCEPGSSHCAADIGLDLRSTARTSAINEHS